MKKRSKFSHETSLILKRVDLTQALAFGLLAAIIHLLGAREDSPIAISLAACTLYSAAVIYRNISAVVAITFFAVLSSALAPTDDVVRLTAFAALLAFSASRENSLPPFITLLASWVVYLCLAQSFSAAGDHTALISILLSETAGCLILTLVFSSRAANRLLRRQLRPMGTRSFMVQVVTLPALFSSIFAVWFSLELLSIPAADLMQTLGEQAEPAAVAILVLVSFPAIVGLLVSKALLSMIAAVGDVANPNNRLVKKNSRPPMFCEFTPAINKLRAEIDSVANNLKTAQLRVKDLLHEAQQKEADIQEREISAYNLTNLMNNAPWGFAAISGSGLVIEVNETFLRLLRLNREETNSIHFSALSGESPWVGELQSLLTWITRDLRRLIGKPPIKHYTSCWDGRYLEILVEITHSSEAELVDIKRDELCAPSDTAVTVYLRDLPDIREFQLQLLSPNKVEILGAEALETARELRRNISNLLGHLTLATAKLTSSNNPFLTSLLSRPEGMELLLLLKDVDKLARQSSMSLDDLFNRSTGFATTKIECNLSTLAQNALDHLHQLLNLDERIVVSSYGGMGPVVFVEGSAALPPGSTEGDVFIRASMEEVSRFIAYFAAMIRNFMARTINIEVSLGYEAIGTGTANILPGSYPGNYARVVLHHSGQSITANMLNQRPLSNTKDLNSLEVALALLTLQTKYLGGFLSVQSTQAKGTTLTIYLPVEADVRPDNLTKVHRSPKHLRTPEHSFKGEAPRTKKALLVGADPDAVLAGSNMLKHLGYTVECQSPEALSTKLQKPVGFSGSGFGTLGDSAEHAKADLLLENPAREAFELIVVNIELVTSTAVRLLQNIEVEYPAAATLLLIDSSPEADEIFGDWPTIVRPFTPDELQAAIEESRSRS